MAYRHAKKICLSIVLFEEKILLEIPLSNDHTNQNVPPKIRFEKSVSTIISKETSQEEAFENVCGNIHTLEMRLAFKMATFGK